MAVFLIALQQYGEKSKRKKKNPKKKRIIYWTKRKVCGIIPSLTVSKRKNRCIPCIYWVAAIFAVVTKYSNLFPSFTFFLDSSHFTFGYVLIIGSKATGLMKIIRNSFPFI